MMFLVDSIPVNLPRSSQKRWKRSLLWTNMREGGVTPLGTVFQRPQSVVMLLKVQYRASQKLHNILLTNWISTMWRYMSWTTSLTISASFATFEIQDLNSQNEWWGILNKRTNNRIVKKAPSRFCEWQPERCGFSITSLTQSLDIILAMMIFFEQEFLSREWCNTRDPKFRPSMTWPSGVQCLKGSCRSTLLAISRYLPPWQGMSNTFSISVVSMMHNTFGPTPQRYWWCLFHATRRQFIWFVALGLVLATGPNCRVGSGCDSTQKWTMATCLTTRKSRTIGHEPVLPPTTQHFKFTMFAPIKYLSSDRTMT